MSQLQPMPEACAIPTTVERHPRVHEDFIDTTVNVPLPATVFGAWQKWPSSACLK
jgi:hypothetical protein